MTHSLRIQYEYVTYLTQYVTSITSSNAMSRDELRRLAELRHGSMQPKLYKQMMCRTTQP